MWAAGIAAVGDVSNSSISLETKKSSKIHYHTFVETFGFHPSRADRAFHLAKNTYNEFIANQLPASIVPHSPYSVSQPLFQKVKTQAEKKKTILSIHNQESEGEAQFYKNGTGPIAEHLQNNLGIDISHWQPTGKSSLLSILKYLPEKNPLLLVHNTFTQKNDLNELRKNRNLKNTYFVFCPNSNLFIENQLPQINLFRKEKLNICIGTDSLASNESLSVLNELITIQHHFPEIELVELFCWAGINGARALRIENKFGSFEKGKQPGVNLITGIDFQNMKLTQKSKVKRLM
jgi:cytosine/adenosine deaminase-related metal-dependent hydrolase